ncbi:hypothetical protein AAES_105635 [Amazona aestiva]|uniref:Uncharacterized protein n=1 Tax=Amazona aestiva TaxID=12930 RepID=A0A0Q3PTA2_AMAAE|nr:hypothetical protein AAES_105635 [Amazona aestiva]
MDQINGFADIIKCVHLVIVENTGRKGYFKSIEILIDGWVDEIMDLAVLFLDRVLPYQMGSEYPVYLTKLIDLTTFSTNQDLQALSVLNPAPATTSLIQTLPESKPLKTWSH